MEKEQEKLNHDGLTEKAGKEVDKLMKSLEDGFTKEKFIETMQKAQRIAIKDWDKQDGKKDGKISRETLLHVLAATNATNGDLANNMVWALNQTEPGEPIDAERVYNRMNEHMLQGARNMFEVLDMNKDGKIDAADQKEIEEYLKPSPTPPKRESRGEPDYPGKVRMG